MQKIAKEEGVPALWNGVEASFILSGNPAIHFMVYEALKRVVLKARGARGKTAVSGFIFYKNRGYLITKCSSKKLVFDVTEIR